MFWSGRGGVQGERLQSRRIRGDGCRERSMPCQGLSHPHCHNQCEDILVITSMSEMMKAGVPGIWKCRVLRGRSGTSRDKPCQPQGDSVRFRKVTLIILLSMKSMMISMTKMALKMLVMMMMMMMTERTEQLLVSNRQTTFDRQLDVAQLGRYGSQVNLILWWWWWLWCRWWQWSWWWWWRLL